MGDVKIGQIRLAKVEEDRGSLCYAEEGTHLPFLVKRIYYIYNVPTESERGAHAHRNLEQVLIAVNGSFDIEIDDGYRKETIHLNEPSVGLYIGKMHWRRLFNFSESAICLVLASLIYEEKDYIRNYYDFAREMHGKN